MDLFSSNVVYQRNYPVENIKDDESKTIPPSFQMIESVRKFGVIQPIVLYGNKDNCRVIVGRRRLAASKKLGLKTIPVLIYPEDWNPQEVIALVENHQRKANILNDLHNIESLLKKGWDENKIRSFTGISKQSFKRLVSISNNLIEPLRIALDDNLISVSVACEISKKNKRVQDELLIKMVDDNKLTIKDVKEVCKVNKSKAVSTLPKSLFEDNKNEWKEKAKRMIEETKQVVNNNASEEVKNMLDKILSMI